MRAFLLFIVLFCVSFPGTLPAAGGGTDIKSLTSYLLEKARKSRKDLGTMPRVDDGLPAQYPEVTSNDVIDALGGKLNGDEDIDTYMKFQLMVFPHDFSKATSQQIIHVINAAPPYPPRPYPTRKQYVAFKKGESTVLPKPAIEPVVKEYHGIVGGAGTQHRPLHDYRKAISDALTDRPDLQLLIEVRKAVDGHLANEWFAKETMEKATEQAGALKGSGKPVDGLVKKTMLDLLASLENANKQDAYRNRVHWVSLEGDGKIRIHTFAWLVDGDIFKNLRQAILDLPVQ